MSNRRIQLGRVYDEPAETDGQRVLVDRLWPRGIRKTDQRVGEWLPAAAPSADLRRWYNHQPERFADFCKQYEQELHTVPEAEQAVKELRQLAQQGPLTLTTATHDIAVSHVPTLASVVAHRP